MNKKVNTFMKYLETVHPLQAEVHLNTPYDIKVYETSHSEERNYLTTDDPLGDPENRERLYDKCIEYVVSFGLRKIQEYLFYSTYYQQGMIMTYRPDTRRKGLWCFSILSVLPHRKHMLQPYHPTKKLILERLISRSHMPPQALRYILGVADVDDKLRIAWENVTSNDWNSVTFNGNYSLRFTLDQSGISLISSDSSYRSLRLIEV